MEDIFCHTVTMILVLRVFMTVAWMLSTEPCLNILSECGHTSTTTSIRIQQEINNKSPFIHTQASTDEYVRYGGKDSLFLVLKSVFIPLCHTSYINAEV